jgi:hypothetical protein
MLRIMPGYWITVHWPHPAADDLPWYVYLREHYRHLGDDLAPGDRVLFYETRQTRPVMRYVRRLEDDRQVELGRGRGGIVCAAEAVSAIERRPRNEIRYDYGHGNCYEWAFHARCHRHEWGHVVPHRDVKDVLGYRMLFPGGLRRISRDQYDRIVTLLRIGRRSSDRG